MRIPPASASWSPAEQAVCSAGRRSRRVCGEPSWHHAPGGEPLWHGHGTRPRPSVHEAEPFFPRPQGGRATHLREPARPLACDDEALGTLWAIRHTPEERFDAEDARVLQSLARFAAAAFHMTRPSTRPKRNGPNWSSAPGPYTRLRPGSSSPSISSVCRPTPGIRPPVRWIGMPASRRYGACPRMLMSTTRCGYPAFIPRIALRSMPCSRIVSTPQVTGSITSTIA